MRPSNLIRPIARPGSYICRACQPPARRHQVRQSSSGATVWPPAPPPSGWANLRSRRLISLTGTDAAKFLNGVITNTFTGDKPIYTAFLSSQGRILHDVFIYPHPKTEHGFVIEVDAATADTLARHIRRFRLRSKFEIRLVPEGEANVVQSWGGRDSVTLSDIRTPGPNKRYQLEDPRAPGLGIRRLVYSGADSSDLFDVEMVPESAYTIRRYLHGVAEGAVEIIPESALPAETNLDIAGAIDWHKGCYVGQELTIRTRHRGVVRKRILPCMIYGGEDGEGQPPKKLEYRDVPEGVVPADMVPGGTTVEAPGGGKRKSAGKWLKGIGNVGLALCRLEMVSKGLSEVPEGQFIMRSVEDAAEGQEASPKFEVKVKPFLPEWLVKGMEEQKPTTS